jgi:hypothetical protein
VPEHATGSRAAKPDLLRKFDKLAPLWLSRGVMTLPELRECRSAYITGDGWALNRTSRRLYRCASDVDAQMFRFGVTLRSIFQRGKYRRIYRRAVVEWSVDD